MEFGIDPVTNHRIRPAKKKEAYCGFCKEILIPKCGNIRLHHWAHKSSHCDHWWEGETEWHREWKNHFPEEWREIIMFDSENENEKHICDIYNQSKALVIEFQNSPISHQELESRELFYKKMIWVVNSDSYKIELQPIENSIAAIDKIESLFYNIKLNNQIRFSEEKINKLTSFRDRIKCKLLMGSKIEFHKLLDFFNAEFDALISEYQFSETYSAIGKSGEDVLKILINPIIQEMKNEVDNCIQKNSCLSPENQYYSYFKQNRKNVWDYSTKPVFLDIGSELLWIKSHHILKRVPKSLFIEKYTSESNPPIKNTVTLPKI